MLTVMYPLTVQADYSELKYSLRSVEKYLPGHEVVIVGDNLPGWLCNVTQIALPDVKGRKQLSIRKKILAALEYTEEILFMNDDVYLLQEHDTFHYYFQGHLKNHVSESGAKILMNELTAMGKPVKDFDGHYPLIYKQDFKEACEHFTGDCVIKSMYCNYLEIDGEHKRDCKMINAKVAANNFTADLPCFSTGQYSLKTALPLLQQLFPLPSIYEL